MPTSNNREYKRRYGGQATSIQNPSRMELDSGIKGHRTLAKREGGIGGMLHNATAMAAARTANSRNRNHLDDYRRTNDVTRDGKTVKYR